MREGGSSARLANSALKVDAQALAGGLPLAREVRGASPLADAGLLAGRQLQLAGEVVCSGPGCSEASLSSSLQGMHALACRSGSKS